MPRILIFTLSQLMLSFANAEETAVADVAPGWWLPGARNNEPPIQEPDEDVCWPITGSGEIDIFEHHGSGGANHYTARIIKSLGHCDGGDWK